MARVKLRSDGETVDLDKQEAEHAHLTAKAKRVIITSTNATTYVKIDPLGYLVTLPPEHYKVHDEKFFICSDYDDNVDIATPKKWLMTTPNSTTRFHVKINVECDTGSLLELYENPTVSTTGTVLTAYNADRNSTSTTTMIFYKDATTSASGTRLQVARVGAGRDRRLGGVARERAEWILKQDEDYMIVVTVDSDNAEATVNIEGYET